MNSKQRPLLPSLERLPAETTREFSGGRYRRQSLPQGRVGSIAERVVAEPVVD